MKINKSTILKIVLLTIVTVLISIFYTNNQRSQFIHLEKQEITEQYVNEEVGFSFEYPSSITVFEWHSSDFENYKELLQTIIVSIEEREMYADGACGASNPATFDFEKKYLDSNFIEREFLEENQDFSKGRFVISGVHKVITTKTGEKALLTIRACQGHSDEDDFASTSILAHVYQDDFRIRISLRDMEGFDPEVKVRDIEKVANQLMNGTYNGEMQIKLNQFVDIISTFEWN